MSTNTEGTAMENHASIFTDHPFQVTATGLPVRTGKQPHFEIVAKLHENGGTQRVSFVGTPEQLRHFLGEVLLAVAEVDDVSTYEPRTMAVAGD